ncbi:DUF1727 domain-containing protein, partial [Candidatus Roizmanbacteria bacterium]|nr:DUF1727 domain-containing protein [Candidatus Roizmanbacteria bacterium]
MSLRTTAAFTLGKLVGYVSRSLQLGSGITWAGEIALRIDPSIISFIRTHTSSIILVAGTNGKTTTVSMIKHLLEKKGYTVIHNATGANLRNGIVGTFITHYNNADSSRNCYALFEVDEAELSNIAHLIAPNSLVLLNLFRDQLDRYGEVNSITEKWAAALQRLDPETSLIVNADDPALSYVAEKSGLRYVHFFGISEPSAKAGKHLDVWADSIYCSNCGGKLAYDQQFFSHLGNWDCSKCNRKRKKLEQAGGSIPLSLSGKYNQYNAAAALLAVKTLNVDVRVDELADFKPAFGRQEEFTVRNRTIKLFLSKNPTGSNESIRTVLSLNPHPHVLFVLNDRIPDGTDVSWIWDVAVEAIVQSAASVICSGDRVWDMALRLQYAQKFKIQNSKFKIE